MGLLEVTGLKAGYHNFPVVDGLSFRVEHGELVSLLGPSGCGKTTLLRALAGFATAEAGEIRLDGEVISDQQTHVAPERRRLGMVFQDHALFPHLTVRQNIEFGLRSLAASERANRVGALLELTALESTAERYPHEVSGGQQQRVALARALAPEPSIILLDEPFSNLDSELRERLAREVADILRDRGIAGILVTHDQNEAFALGEKVGVMFAGRLHQWDTPFRLYHEPADRAVADFIGQGVFVPGTITRRGFVQTVLGELGLADASVAEGRDVDVLIRPDDLVPDPNGALGATVVSKAFRGAETLYQVQLSTGERLLSLFPSHGDHEIGAKVQLRLELRHCVVFQRESL
ncbi:MAG: ABC transporter ATP-binding protein [Gammaproteobacteria bacterium]|nr:ABC transporter ATP-binding protein [Gammaproteobacteria bacterium]